MRIIGQVALSLTCAQNAQASKQLQLNNAMHIIAANFPLALPQMESFISGGGVHLDLSALSGWFLCIVSRCCSHRMKMATQMTPTIRRAMISKRGH